MIVAAMVVGGEAAEAPLEGGLIPEANRLMFEDIPRDRSKLLLPLFLPPLCMTAYGASSVLLSRLSPLLSDTRCSKVEERGPD